MSKTKMAGNELRPKKKVVYHDIIPARPKTKKVVSSKPIVAPKPVRKKPILSDIVSPARPTTTKRTAATQKPRTKRAKDGPLRRLPNKAKGAVNKVVSWWKAQDAKYGFRWRLANGLAALVILSSVITPVILQLQGNRAYQLSNATLDLVGKTDPKLTSKLSYDAKTKTYQFNKESIKEYSPADALKSQVGTPQQNDKDKALYGLDVPKDMRKGTTYYDTNSQLSFSLVPQFTGREGKLQQQRLVYPLGNNTQAVYTLKNNGLKEDIVIQKATEDTMRFSYTLNLPKTLEAKPLDDGSGAIGIYAANTSLYANMSYGSDKDRELVEKARQNSTKDTLVFGIPTPTITTSKGDDSSKAKARFELKGNTLTVIADNLTTLKQPFSIDPSVVITSASDFENGNGDGSISFATAGQISRATLTGGTVASWSTDGTDTTPTTSNYTKIVFYNGYYYLFNFAGGTGGSQTPYYAAAQSGGDIGAWTATTNLPNAIANQNIGVAAYNGYLYITEAGTTVINKATYYIKINSNGSLAGSWTAGPNLNVSRGGGLATAYNGRLYVVSGCTSYVGFCLAQTKTVEYATINPDGSLGSWITTSSTNNNHTNAIVKAYNGYLYTFGSGDNGGTSIEYAPINSDGSLGTWVVNSNSLITACQLGAGTIANGYLYYGPCNFQTANNTTQYAPIYANGSVGTVQNTSTLPANRNGVAMETDGKGHIVVLGGGDGSNPVSTIYYTSINSAGAIGSYATSANPIDSDPGTGGNQGIQHAASVAYGGFIYLLGGFNGAQQNTVYKAAITATGEIGAWATTSAFTTTRSRIAATAYNGYMYIAGGQSFTATSDCVSGGTVIVCGDIQYAAINADGTLGSWASAGGNYSALKRMGLRAVAYSGYMYVIGGTYNNNSNTTNEVDYALICTGANNGVGGCGATAGTVGTWNTTASLNNARGNFGIAQYGKYVYVTGGRSASNGFADNTTEYAILSQSGGISSWTTSGNNFTNGRHALGASIWNGYLYITGGSDNSNTGTSSYFGDTQYAKIDISTGAIGSWTTSPVTFATNRGAHTTVIAAGNIYVIAGCSNLGLFESCNALQSDVQYAQINNGGSGAPNTWVDQGATGAGRIQLAGASYNGYVYIVGGCTGNLLAGALGCTTIGMQSDVRYAAMGNDGTIGSWASAGPSLSTGRSGLAAVASNGYLYILGGCSAGSGGDCTTFQNDVQYALICTGSNAGVDGCSSTAGTIGTTWHTTNAFSTGRYGQSVAVYGGYMYVLGGCSATSGGSCTTFKSDVQKALICTGNNNGVGGCGATAGEVGTWSSAGSDFTTGRLYQSATINNGYLYVLGGCSAMTTAKVCTTFQNDVQYRAIDSATGSLSGSWANGTSFGPASLGSVALSFNGNLYLVGGCTSFSSTNCVTQDSIIYAPFGVNGLIGNWTMSATRLASARALHASVISKGYLTVLNGVTQTNSFVTTASTAVLQVQPRVGLYSKLLTFNFSTSVRNITYNGTLGNGTSDISYRGSSNGTSWTGGVTSASSLTNARCPSPASNRYLQLFVTLDDTQRGTFPDESANAANLTDLTLSYEFARSPNMRLKLGKILQETIGQTDLDICKLSS